MYSSVLLLLKINLFIGFQEFLITWFSKTTSYFSHIAQDKEKNTFLNF
jgi:hypothetical protein